MATHAFTGTWEIVYINAPNTYDSCGLEGVRFRLDENGDVTWTVSEELMKSVPLFNCETYELYSTSVLGVVLRFGAYAGHVIKFKSNQIEPKDTVSLTCEEWGDLFCKRIREDPTEANCDSPFSLLPALEGGYFADLNLIASNNKEFKVHSTIIQLLGSDIPWQANPSPFAGLSEDVAWTILFYLYAECLPQSLSEATARQVIKVAAQYASLGKLVDMCQGYLKNMALKQQIISLVNEMHNCLNQVIEHFSPKQNQPTAENLASNPAKLCFVVKQTVRDAAVAGVKFLLLCDLFTKRRNELSREERHEIIRYAKSRLPIFLTQLHRFLHALKSTFCSMSTAQRHEVATYLVPEIEIILETVSKLTVEIEKALQQIIKVIPPHDNVRTKSGVGDMLGKRLRNILHSRELNKLRNFHDHFTCSLGLLLVKKEQFNEMTRSQKIRSVARNLEQMIVELPIFLLRLEEVTATLDGKLEWREFKFCFKVGTSKVYGILQKLVAHKETLKEIMTQVCELVQRDTFTQSLQSLGLLDVNPVTGASGECQNMSKSTSFSAPKQHQQTYKLNLVEALCVSPLAKESTLSQLALQLLKSEIGTDMEFEIISNSLETSNTEQTEEAAAAAPVEEEKTTIKAHRVIVAARCDWFRRALLSGMREAINRKITIHDSSPFMFRIFLEYLYSGRLRQNALNETQLADLLLLSDRYEVDTLKQVCEYALQPSIDLESVLYLLTMADQFNANILKEACMDYISEHNQEVTSSELFADLPIVLQKQIHERPLTHPPPPPPRKSTTMEHLLPASFTPTTPDTSFTDMQRGMTSFHISSQFGHSNSGSLDEFHVSQDTARLETCIAQLRDILGDTASRDILVTVILAADYDLRRAVNYFYTRIGNDQ